MINGKSNSEMGTKSKNVTKKKSSKIKYLAFWSRTGRKFRGVSNFEKIEGGDEYLYTPTQVIINLLEPLGNENAGFVVLFPAIWSSQRGL